MDEISPSTHLIIKGARQHNLKNVNLTVPKNQLVVFTGVSGSGKSSMAHDTIYAEGQRRYVESLSSYARQFLGVMDKPDVDSIEGLSPAILIDQKQGSHNPRSTVGTVTEIYDYLRLLFARAGHPHCPECGREVMAQDVTQIRDAVFALTQCHPTMTKQKGVRLMIMAPVVKNKKGEFKDLLVNLAKKGIGIVRVDGKFINTNSPMNLFKNNRHDIDAVIDKIVIGKEGDGVETQTDKSRLIESIETALKLAGGEVIASVVIDASLSFPENPKDLEDHLFSENLACPFDNISLPKLEPRYFSFNSPDGACPTCTGLGSKLTLNKDLILAPSLTLKEGGVVPLASQFETETWMARLITKVMADAGFKDRTPLEKMNHIQKRLLFDGTGTIVHGIHGLNSQGKPTIWHTPFTGLTAEFERRYQETSSQYVREELDQYMIKLPCPDCHGDRLKPEVLGVTINAMNISQVTAFSIDKAYSFIKELSGKLNLVELQIATPILKEIRDRLEFLQSVGLSYLTINREAGSLSGGELQRIRLASQIGSRLTGILYVLDEPTIGLHQRDNQKLINTLKNLVSLGNTLVVVEHDRDTILSADHLVEFGPAAGENGGELTFQGNVGQIKGGNCLTGQYLSNKKRVLPNKTKRKPIQNSEIVLKGCTHHNLKDIAVELPLGKLIGVTGVSGSGKSSLIVDTLYEALARQLNRQHQRQEIPFESVKFLDVIKRVSLIDQSPIGRTPRSNPATYTKLFDYVRGILAGTKDAHLRGYGPGRFSFNVKGGRCETCQGEGQIKIEMQFMGDIYVTCQTCHGTRFNQPTLEINYKGKNIAEVLDMTIDQAADFFKGVPAAEKKLSTMKQVGLGYIRLGQPAPTLSGGEAQRVKLASELAKTGSGHTVYILDEPTTGLHFEDVGKLMQTLVDLVENDNTVIVIEHNLDVIKNCDYLIDMGPEGGEGGGEIIAAGTPEEVTRHFQTPTAEELKKVLVDSHSP
ncbi:excinuclease ABC subunit A [Candidatus Collierbacteria bacterium RIFCSPHIGHO2_01_FULL_50_25]|uniref:UvrABC system protein A n=1 Tax=Candidatus Collierbacteria bacterium RIFCSPHIGHO2_01_FULL_50_25 TaxID=1817722 RepID=A0A1F5EWD8_9BACT|nr:MAG: excinuclease ABC subunit A [Candidatus Collierbacteria bacterium RIFCSPHIGHO2_01_FULL_50_25]